MLVQLTNLLVHYHLRHLLLLLLRRVLLLHHHFVLLLQVLLLGREPVGIAWLSLVGLVLLLGCFLGGGLELGIRKEVGAGWLLGLLLLDGFLWHHCSWLLGNLRSILHVLGCYWQYSTLHNSINYKIKLI